MRHVGHRSVGSTTDYDRAWESVSVEVWDLRWIWGEKERKVSAGDDCRLLH